MSIEQPRNPLVVLIHGYLDDPTVWRDVAEALQGEGIRTIAPEIARHTGELTLDTFADRVTEVTAAALAAEDVEGVVLVGHSMGAQVAELAARDIGDAVAGLVLLTPIPLQGLALPDEVAGPLRGCAGSTEIQRALRSQLSAALDDDAIKRLVRIGVDVPKGRVEGWFDAWTTGDAPAAGQAPPRIPTMVLSGGEDPFVNKDILGLIEARFGDAVQHSIPGAGHWPHVEAPGTVAAELVSFLRAVAAARADATVTEDGWTGAFAAKQSDAFAATLAPDVALHASALRRPVTGRDDVAYLMGEASQIYEQLEFVHEAKDGRLTFLEWHARTRSGVSLEGVTVLERDDAGLISRVAIHHRPLDGVLAFSAELRDRTVGRLGDGYLWSATSQA
ncbi:Pimeloyl-ACP methyl ester carboxylesterase [Actinokineospora alba]|uniref:Pimeloyl-ACP methyl ester carboxylesterase n=1 Tax=Actinokineospora alba TaxID=504798 RepID=A0A1H0FRH4_9PSEU|nr:alpha/beta fold hydrolase [Actinokineospora alba]TDP69586.1 pimeloyl-ACP methyl ester carboxylesterase [Actinokineospora alba]SDI13585.1 Pimeloyl-ACP methyl ester carboxylesterase [Actinokineospora alba]SDN97283.1 Pimeloyl-ACP methyl ester carboxylesterase [Actinokineospora alba]